MNQDANELRLDHAFRVGSARSNDTLNRGAFAHSVTQVLKRVSKNAGLVVSVEGSWGSGKTSLLAMLEETLGSESESERPIIVHFNPWLVGNREALLRQFLGSITKAIKLADHAKDGKRVAKELKTYGKAFDILKLIPGAEPWSSMVKAVFESVSDATDSLAEYKTPDIETRKEAVENALRKYSRRIVVLIDDLDRLFPAEVFEMVRIVKAVGDLPNIGYVLAWDPSYVSAALEKLHVPFATTYLDKVVQVRLPIPPLSLSMRTEMMDELLSDLPTEALRTYFPNGEERLPLLFHHGLSELIETPRDVVRLHDVVKTIEPGLRGEIHLADIIGLACLMTKAPDVYQLLHRVPQAFVGRRPGARTVFEKAEDVIKEFENERAQAFAACYLQRAIRELVHWLFPLVPENDDGHTQDTAIFIEGHLAHPGRLLIALQLSMQPDDVSLVRVQQFITQPAKREAIVQGLQGGNCMDFLHSISSMVSGWSSDAVVDIGDLSVAIARVVDSPVVADRARNPHSFWESRSERSALEAIENLTQNESEQSAQLLAERLIADPFALSVAALLALRSYSGSKSDGNYRVSAEDSNRTVPLAAFAENLEIALMDGSLFNKSHPHIILHAAARLIPERCHSLFQASITHDRTGDKFVEAHLRTAVDSTNGQRYGLPTNIAELEVFAPLQTLKEMGDARLQDIEMGYPTRAAWRAIVEEREIYGKDGTLALD